MCNQGMPASLSLATGICLLLSAGCKDDGLMDGACGLKGKRVECVTHFDCEYPDDTCDWSGFCYNDESVCYGPTSWCSGGVCNAINDCSPACSSHSDCSSSQVCTCFPPELLDFTSHSAGWCDTAWCRDKGAKGCPPGTETIPGILTCRRTQRDADCHLENPESPTAACPPGYDREGEIGCHLVTPNAWRDAGAPQPDASAGDAGSPDAGIAADAGR